MECDHELTGDPDEGDSGGSALSENDVGDVYCILCNKKWVLVK